jgi:hypothetical protein
MRLFGIAFLSAGTIAIIACGSKSESTTGSASATTTSGKTTATTGSTASTTAGAGGATTTTGSGGAGGGGNACIEKCLADHPDGFKKFSGLMLKECGCATGQPCADKCKNNCPDKVPMDTMDPCGGCLTGEAAKGQSSPCTLKAGLACLGDTACKPFVDCAQACPMGG